MGVVCFPICVTASYNSVSTVQHEVQCISVLKSTVCVTGGRVLTAATDQIMVSFWFMCRVLWPNIQTLHGAENKKEHYLEYIFRLIDQIYFI
jgi:hypothetical protein